MSLIFASRVNIIEITVNKNVSLAPQIRCVAQLSVQNSSQLCQIFLNVDRDCSDAIKHVSTCCGHQIHIEGAALCSYIGWKMGIMLVIRPNVYEAF